MTLLSQIHFFWDHEQAPQHLNGLTLKVHNLFLNPPVEYWSMPSPSGYSGKRGITWHNHLSLRENNILSKHKTCQRCVPQSLLEAQVLIYILQSKFLTYCIGPAKWCAQMHHYRIPSACVQSKYLLESMHMQHLARKPNVKYQITFWGDDHQNPKCC